jgi:serine protease Do
MSGTPGANRQLNQELEIVADRLRRSTVQVRARGGHGSGVIATPNGLIVTNAHVAAARTANVVLPDGRELEANVIARTAERDLALLSVDAAELPAANFRDSRSLRPDDLVLAVGKPLHLVGAVTAGVVYAADARGRRVVADVRLLPGNSGGPLADAEGRLVGVNAMVVNGLAVAIASSAVLRYLKAPNSRPYAGVVTRPVIVEVMGERRLGMLITELVVHGAAARSGVLAGDVVIGVDGHLFDSPSDLPDSIDAAEVGAHLRLDIVRAGRVTGVDVVVGDAAEEHAPAA